MQGHCHREPNAVFRLQLHLSVRATQYKDNFLGTSSSHCEEELWCRCSCSPLALFEPALSGLQALLSCCLAHRTSQCANTPECTQTTATAAHRFVVRHILSWSSSRQMLSATTRLHGHIQSRRQQHAAKRMLSSYSLLRMLQATSFSLHAEERKTVELACVIAGTWTAAAWHNPHHAACTQCSIMTLLCGRAIHVMQDRNSCFCRLLQMHCTPCHSGQ